MRAQCIARRWRTAILRRGWVAGRYDRCSGASPSFVTRTPRNPVGARAGRPHPRPAREPGWRLRHEVNVLGITIGTLHITKQTIVNGELVQQAFVLQLLPAFSAVDLVISEAKADYHGKACG